MPSYGWCVRPDGAPFPRRRGHCAPLPPPKGDPRARARASAEMSYKKVDGDKCDIYNFPLPKMSEEELHKRNLGHIKAAKIDIEWRYECDGAPRSEHARTQATLTLERSHCAILQPGLPSNSAPRAARSFPP